MHEFVCLSASLTLFEFVVAQQEMIQRHVTRLDIGNADDIEELERAQAIRRMQGRPPLGSTGPHANPLFADDSDGPRSTTPSAHHRSRGTPPPDRWE